MFPRSKHRYPGNESMAVVFTGPIIRSTQSMKKAGELLVDFTPTSRQPISTSPNVVFVLHGPVTGISSKKKFFQMEQTRGGKVFKVNVRFCDKRKSAIDPDKGIQILKELKKDLKYGLKVHVVADLPEPSSEFDFTKSVPLQVVAKEVRIYLQDDDELETDDQEEVVEEVEEGITGLTPKEASAKVEDLKREWAGKGLPDARE